jgi:RNA polymerase sigma factor (sigma-70 family)
MVTAARDGDQRALDALVAEYLPLIYNVVGRALHGHADVDDLVQETMLRIVDGLPKLRDPARFRSWAVAIAMNLVRDRHRRSAEQFTTTDDDLADPGADFADLAIVRLRLSGQRHQVAEATRWLDPDDRELLSLWWLEAAGQLSRDEVVEALRIPRQHAAVRIQRMKAQLDAARAVVRALGRPQRCPDLATIAALWNGRPDPLWRKRFARHTRDCDRCAPAWSELIAAERLLIGLALVPVPFAIALTAKAAAPVGTFALFTGARHAARIGTWAAFKPAGAAIAAVAVIGGAAAGVVALQTPEEVPPRQPAAVAATTATGTPGVAAPPPSASVSAVSTTPATSPVPAPPPAVRSAKKGVSTYSFAGNAQALRDVRATWYYNWAAERSVAQIDGVEFVPMIWGANSVTAPNLAKARAQGRTLLAFNEPDLGEQANMSVERALELWPQLAATGMRLSSPAVAYGADTPGGWFDRFMSGARARGYRIDFIALHWYGSDFSAAAVGHLRGYIEKVYDRYKLPIWLTEYALISFSGGVRYPTQDQQVAFVRNSTTMLQSLSFVERYAWFALPSGKSGDTGLYSSGTTPTGVGVAYRAAGG